MKKNTIALLLVIFTVAGLFSCSGKKEQDEKLRKGWTLVWEDDFKKSMDESIWSKIPKGKVHMDRYMSSNEGLYVFHEGNLVLRGVQNSVANDSLPFLTGGITTDGKKKLNSVCRIEVRARMTPVMGAASFISLLPADKSKNISIDAMERYGIDEFMYQSVSSEYTTTQGMADNPASSALVSVNPNQYQIYGVEKYPDSIVFFVNNQRTKKYPRILTDIEGQFPFNDQDFNLFMGVRLNRDVDAEGLPVDMFIDWVRYYEPEVIAAE